MEWRGELVKKRAQEIGIALINIAESIGVSRQTVHSWINGQIPQGYHLVKLCKILEASPDAFFTSEVENLISLPQHRTIMKKRVTPEMRNASVEMAKQYLNLFRNASAYSMVNVLRIHKHTTENPREIATKLRELSEIKNDKPIDFYNIFILISKLGIYTIFRPFPATISRHIYAFYTKIFERRVIFVNTNTNIIDLNFQLLHETVHSIRDEEPDLINDSFEEEFCDQVANYVQFPSEYVHFVAACVSGLEPGIIINKLKEFSTEYSHSLFGICKQLEPLGICKDLNVGGAATKLKKKFPTIGEILFQEGDPRYFVDMLCDLSPLFMALILDQIPNCSTRKLGEWLGLDNTIDSIAVIDELKRKKARS